MVDRPQDPSTLPSLPSVLVGVLHVGEPSLPRVLDRIGAQVDVDVELLEIGHHPEREAHDLLYRAFDAADPRHDALVKVDADMELVEPRVLHAIGMLFRRHPELDNLVLGVDDWFSGRRIQGMIAWRNGVRWTSPAPELFTDLPDDTARSKLKLIDVGRPLVLHAADPTDEQAVRYGLHRGLKAMATGKAGRIERLLDVVDHAQASPARGRRLAVAAIGLALEDPTAGTELLGRARGDADLDALLGRLDDPRLVDDVRDKVRTLLARTPAGPADRDAREDDHEDAGRLTALTAALHAIRRRLPGGDTRRAPDRAAQQAVWRSEFLTLLARR
jgi:hypothetical protein